MTSVFQLENVTMKYEDRLIQQDLTFDIEEGEIFVIMGGSGCGKSTLLRHLIGLIPPSGGKIWCRGENFWDLSEPERLKVMRTFGVLYQRGALWSSRTLFDNVALPLEEFTTLSKGEIRDLVEFKLSLVGLSGFGGYYPSEISGGMQKRAGLARAMALDPKILFFDEPSAGLDPITSSRLDELIVELRDSLGATIILVTHELPSIFYVATNSVFLDAQRKTIIARGAPKDLLNDCPDATVQAFLRREPGEDEMSVRG